MGARDFARAERLETRAFAHPTERHHFTGYAFSSCAK
jgi:hypothetical protein